MKPPKYTLPEIERRWLADLKQLPALSTLECITIEDLYIANSRLRLRKMLIHGSDTVQFKLGKKYGKTGPFSEPTVNIYLTQTEYDRLSSLPGKRLIRQRYHYNHDGTQFRISTIPAGGPTIVEAEFESEEAAQECVPPQFCTIDVSTDAAYEGPSLAI